MKKFLQQLYHDNIGSKIQEIDFIYNFINKGDEATDEQKDFRHFEMVENRFRYFFLSFLFVLVATGFLYFSLSDSDNIDWYFTYAKEIWLLVCSLLILIGLITLVYYFMLIIKHWNKKP